MKGVCGEGRPRSTAVTILTYLLRGARVALKPCEDDALVVALDR